MFWVGSGNDIAIRILFCSFKYFSFMGKGNYVIRYDGCCFELDGKGMEGAGLLYDFMCGLFGDFYDGVEFIRRSGLLVSRGEGGRVVVSLVGLLEMYCEAVHGDGVENRFGFDISCCDVEEIGIDFVEKVLGCGFMGDVVSMVRGGMDYKGATYVARVVEAVRGYVRVEGLEVDEFSVMRWLNSVMMECVSGVADEDGWVENDDEVSEWLGDKEDGDYVGLGREEE